MWGAEIEKIQQISQKVTPLANDKNIRATLNYGSNSFAKTMALLTPPQPLIIWHKHKW